MKHFSIAELSRSTTAIARGIDNTPPSGVVVALTALIEQVLDPIRAAWGKPIIINSGYRSLALNKAVGGASTSQHLRGEAADITAGSKTLNKQLLALIQQLATASADSPAVIEFDQLIDEKGLSWIHISYRANSQNRHQTLKIK